MVGVLEKACIYFHLASEHRLHLGGYRIPGRNFSVPLRQGAVLRYNAELLLACKRFLAQLAPPLVELALVLVRPFLRNMMRGMSRPGSKVTEERLVRHQRLLLPDPVDCLGG